MGAAMTIDEHAKALVRRARAGDQNAMALIYQVGKAARARLNARAIAAYASIKKYIESNPPVTIRSGGIGSIFGFTFGSDPVLASPRVQPVRRAPLALTAGAPVNPESRKPVLPRGALDGICDPERFEICVVRATKYRYGLPAAAVVLATGPALTTEAVRNMGDNLYGEDGDLVDTFFQGVKGPTDEDWRRIAPDLSPEARRALVVGQCVGRARRLQAARQGPISRHSALAGWELGE